MSDDFAKELFTLQKRRMPEFDAQGNVVEPQEQVPAPQDFAGELFSQRFQPGGTAETPTGRSPLPGVIQPEQVIPGGAGFSTNLKAEFVRDPETKKRVVAESIFPNDPDAMDKVGYLDDGRMVAKIGDKFQIVNEGFMSSLGQLTGQTPEIASGIVGSLATGNPFSGAVVGEIGGRSIKQIIGALAFDEPQTMGGNVADLAMAGGLAAIPEAGMAGAVRLRNRAAVRNADKFDLERAQAMREMIRDKTGIDLDLSQASDFRQFRDLKKWAAKYPSESAEIIEELGRVQQGQAQQAVQNILETLSPQADRAAMAQSGVKGARSVIEAAKLQRRIETKELYEAADPVRLPTDVQQSLKADPVFKEAHESVVNDPLFKKELGDAGDTVKAWDLTVRKLDDRIAAAQRAGNNNEARLLMQNREQLIGTLSEVAPEYAAARKAWAEASQRLVDPLQNSSLGVIAGLEEKGLKTTELVAKAAKDILADPATTRSAKLAVEKVSPQSWRDLVRLSMQDAFEKASKETQSGDVVNFAGKFRQAVIGTPARRQAMEAALGKSGDDVFDMTMDAFQRIARDKSLAGSDTAFNQAITEAMRDRSRGLVTQSVRSAAAPLQTIREIGEQRFLEQNAVRIAEALTDPRKAAKLREIRSVTDKTKRDLAIIGVLFGNVAEPSDEMARE